MYHTCTCIKVSFLIVRHWVHIGIAASGPYWPRGQKLRLKFSWFAGFLVASYVWNYLASCFFLNICIVWPWNHNEGFVNQICIRSIFFRNLKRCFQLSRVNIVLSYNIWPSKSNNRNVKYVIHPSEVVFNEFINFINKHHFTNNICISCLYKLKFSM